MKTFDQFSITSKDYQAWAAECVAQFLAEFRDDGRRGGATTPLKIRVHENPPSVQIIKLPEGGAHAGTARIREKLAEESLQPRQTESGFFMQPEMVLAREADLTRECIIVTLRDETVDTILEHELLASQKVAEVLEALRQGHPNFFIVVQRYLLGIEQHDGVKVPFSVVEEHDEQTRKYLENITQHLS